MSYVSGFIYSGSKALTTAPEAISTTARNCREVIIQSKAANTTNVWVGDASAQEIELEPGQSINIPVISLSRVFARMESGTGTVGWLMRD
jgi:hypothetical protein